jgi:hypothetical protein
MSVFMEALPSVWIVKFAFLLARSTSCLTPRSMKVTHNITVNSFQVISDFILLLSIQYTILASRSHLQAPGSRRRSHKLVLYCLSALVF